MAERAVCVSIASPSAAHATYLPARVAPDLRDVFFIGLGEFPTALFNTGFFMVGLGLGNVLRIAVNVAVQTGVDAGKRECDI